MRLDLFLKQTSLVKRRPIAKAMCDAGKVTRNGKPAKAGDEMRANDRLAIDYGTRIVQLEVLAVPTGSVGKAQRDSYFHITGEQRISEEI